MSQSRRRTGVFCMECGNEITLLQEQGDRYPLRLGLREQDMDALRSFIGDRRCVTCGGPLALTADQEEDFRTLPPPRS
jgi:hypothetical protein